MKFIPTPLADVHVLEFDKRQDDRGFFARAWCIQELRQNGLIAEIAQINVGQNPTVGTVRGMHLQSAPHGEVKVVRCARGAVHDVVVDLRPWSKTFKAHYSVELSAANGRSLYIPVGCAHGYQVLQEDSEVQYLTSMPYAPAHATGVRYNDPAFGIAWPLPIALVSEQDRNWPSYDSMTHIVVQP